ncbi:MAG: alpha/beta hydrolase fold domain-containing protein [Solirubrobacterales bacterium]
MIPIRSILRRVRTLLALGAPPALTLRVVIWFWGYVAREFAFQIVAGILVLVGVGALAGWPGGTIATVALAVLGGFLLVELWFAWQSWRSAAAVDRELAEEVPGESAKSRFPRSHLYLPLLMFLPRGVIHRRGVVYHREERRRVRLDVYMPKAAARDDELRPAIVQIHGGGWIFGSRVEQGIPLLNHLAANGWVGFNVDYRLSPRATMPDHVIDVKRAIAWVRENAEEYGVDPERICLTGGSAGGHLCALAALTSEDRSLQPGFEEADTSVSAAVAFYGLYDLLDAERRYYRHIRDWLIARVVVKRDRDTDPDAFRKVSPTHRVHAGAPPFMVFHGEHDSLVPVGDARAFVERLERISESPVLYVELPGSEHAFDLAPSLRCARVVEGIERFLRTVIDPPGATVGQDMRDNELQKVG